jgi:hypothetical protein
MSYRMELRDLIPPSLENLRRLSASTARLRFPTCREPFIYCASTLALLTFGRAWGGQPDGKANTTPTPPPVPPTQQEIAAAYAQARAESLCIDKRLKSGNALDHPRLSTGFSVERENHRLGTFARSRSDN